MSKGIDAREDWADVDRVKAGDDRAFDALMARYKRPVLNFVFRMLGDASEAEDIAQEVFVRAYRNMHKSGVRQKGAAFSTWLFQVARHAALDGLRRRRRRPTTSLNAMEEDGGAVAGRGRTAVEDAIAWEDGEQIAAAVALLPEHQRTTVILSEYENLSYAQIAAVMKCSEKSVETRLYRARIFLRRRLAHLMAQVAGGPCA